MAFNFSLTLVTQKMFTKETVACAVEHHDMMQKGASTLLIVTSHLPDSTQFLMKEIWGFSNKMK